MFGNVARRAGLGETWHESRESPGVASLAAVVIACYRPENIRRPT
jgi:hypothetical protein